MPQEPGSSTPEATEETLAEATAPAESETLVALGDALAPEEAHASTEAVSSDENAAAVATSESTESIPTTDNAEQHAAEAASEPADAAPEETEAAAAEPIMIEVWRMGRQQFQRRPERQQHKRQPRVFNITPRPQKEGGSGAQRFRRDRADEPKPEAEAANAEAHTSERPAPAPDQRPRFKGKDDRRRNERHDDRRGGRPSTFSTETRSRDRAPDPDSPFAKLAALKAELEKNKKG
jgi:ATP-dependent RNA helicase SUPV3L1/SUV3